VEIKLQSEITNGEVIRRFRRHVYKQIGEINSEEDENSSELTCDSCDDIMNRMSEISNSTPRRLRSPTRIIPEIDMMGYRRSKMCKNCSLLADVTKRDVGTSPLITRRDCDKQPVSKLLDLCIQFLAENVSFYLLL
jgi:hypothetical protein